MRKNFFLSALFLLSVLNYAAAQVGIGTTTPNLSAALDITSLNKGLLLPRLTTAQRNAITAPATGLLLYQSDGTPGFYYYTGSSWTSMGFNYVLQQNLNTNGKYLSGDGTSKGLLLSSNGMVLAKGGIYGTGNDLPDSNAGTKLIWYPKKAAFRAGYVSSTQWNNVNIGSYSVAMGYSSKASGSVATALGNATVASGTYATALGNTTTASGSNATAMGYKTTSSGSYAFAAGNQSKALGNTSFALGYKTTASGTGSVALGDSTVASGDYSFAMGTTLYNDFRHVYFPTRAEGKGAIALGMGTYATGDNSIALGVGYYHDLYEIYYPTSAGSGSIAIGQSCQASRGSFAIGNGQIGDGEDYVPVISNGGSSFAIGNAVTASGGGSFAIGSSYYDSDFDKYASTISSGEYAFAIGFGVQASGNFSTAIGSYVSTNLHAGSFTIGDKSTPNTTNNDADNQMMMRFAGGYKLFTNAAATIGVRVVPGGNAWSTLSDRNRKENFAAVNAEAFLNKIAAFKLTSWNYKGQDAKYYRHYGPMAQDFFAAFGSDQYGTIGNDTTINQADFEGINLIAIQALEKRTTELKKENEQLKEKVNQQEQTIAQLQSSFAEQQQLIAQRLAQLEAVVAQKQSGCKEQVAVK